MLNHRKCLYTALLLQHKSINTLNDEWENYPLSGGEFCIQKIIEYLVTLYKYSWYEECIRTFLNFKGTVARPQERGRSRAG